MTLTVFLIHFYDSDCINNTQLCKLVGPPREFLQDRTRLFLGPRGHPETSFKIGDLRSNKTTGKLSSEV